MQELEEIAATLVANAAMLVPSSAEDRVQLDDVLEAGGGQALPYAAFGTGQKVSSAMWAIYLTILGANWEEPASRKIAKLLLMVENIRDRESGWQPLVEAAIAALASLADGPEAALSRMQAFHGLAREVERAGRPELAYDLVATALGLGPPPDAERLAVAEFGFDLGRAARRTHQAAFLAVEVALCKLATSSGNAGASLDAFDACETAVEFILQAEAPYREVAAQRLLQAAGGHSWLQKICLPLRLFVEGQDELARILGFSEWPRRVQNRPDSDWLRDMAVVAKATAFELDIDSERLALASGASVRHANVDWISWSLDHPAFRNAIPHHRSILRDRDFDKHILVLMHELTHALSLLGGIGTALMALRVAAFYEEVELWSIVEPGDAMGDRIEEAIVVPLPPGEAPHLLRAERGLEFTLKAQALQDVWTPWFEGLAVFAEGAADPSKDPNGINPVTHALRNLVDFHPPAGPDGIFDDVQRITDAFEETAREFEQRVGAAIEDMGWKRLYSDVALLADRHYFAGYLAVRSVVSSWRRTLGAAVGGSEAFTLLLHATRFGTTAAIPDLSLPIDEFREAALEKMASFAASLAALGESELREFLAPPDRDGPGRLYGWRAGKLTRLEDGPQGAARAGEEEIALRRRLAQEAAGTLVGEDHIRRLPDIPPEAAKIAALLAKIVRDWNASPAGDNQESDVLQHMDALLARGSLFPLGNCAARFFLNIPPGEEPCRVMSLLRTMEAHVDTGRPSMNGFGFPLERESATELAELYERRRITRLEATRLIDLAGYVCPSGGVASHILAYRLDDWLHLEGPTQAVAALLNADPEHLATVTAQVGRRLSPTRLSRAEMTIADGKLGARRTRDWIAASAGWSLPEAGVDLSGWADHVARRADEVLDQASRPRAWAEGASQLLQALWAEPGLARDLAREPYLDLVSGYPADTCIQALFRSGERPAADDWLDEHEAGLRRDGFAVFEKTVHGWDVRAAAARGDEACR